MQASSYLIEAWKKARRKKKILDSRWEPPIKVDDYQLCAEKWRGQLEKKEREKSGMLWRRAESDRPLLRLEIKHTPLKNENGHLSSHPAILWTAGHFLNKQRFLVCQEWVSGVNLYLRVTSPDDLDRQVSTEGGKCRSTHKAEGERERSFGYLFSSSSKIYGMGSLSREHFMCSSERAGSLAKSWKIVSSDHVIPSSF